MTRPVLAAAMARRRAGEPTAAIADDLGVSPAVLRARWSDAGLRLRRRPMGRVEAARLHARRERGEGTADLAAEVGLTAGALRHHWRRHGLAIARQRTVDGFHLGLAWGHRVDGRSWAEVRRLVGWEGSPATLRARVFEWRRRHGMTGPRDWRERAEVAP